MLAANAGNSRKSLKLKNRRTAGARGGIRSTALCSLFAIALLQCLAMPNAGAQLIAYNPYQHKTKPSKAAAPQPKPKTQQEMLQMLDQVESGAALKPGRSLPAARPAKGYGHLSGYSSHRVAPAAGGSLPYTGGMAQQPMQGMPPGGRQAAALEALRRQAQVMGGGQQMLMRMMQQGGQGAPGGPGGSSFMEKFQQRMHAQGAQGAGALGGNSAIFQKLQQRMQGGNGGGSTASAGFSPAQATATPAQSKRGFLGVFNKSQTSGSSPAGKGGDLEKQMEDMYGK